VIPLIYWEIILCSLWCHVGKLLCSCRWIWNKSLRGLKPCQKVPRNHVSLSSISVYCISFVAWFLKFENKKSHVITAAVRLERGTTSGTSFNIICLPRISPTLLNRLDKRFAKKNVVQSNLTAVNPILCAPESFPPPGLSRPALRSTYNDIDSPPALPGISHSTRRCVLMR